MKLYIDKDALVAEIERRMRHHIDLTWTDSGYRHALFDVLAFIHTLEVKEMDLDRAIDKWIDDAAITHEDCSITDVISTAKHFFELGLKAQKRE